MRVPIETARLRLRPFALDDAELLRELDSDPAVRRYVAMPQAESLEFYRNRLQTVWLPYQARFAALGVWAVEWKASGEFCGWTCIRPALDYRYHEAAGFRAKDVELGYRLRQDAWGQGVATEASQALIPLALEQAGTERIVASALAANRASTRVMEKCGLRQIGQFTIEGSESPALVYAATVDELRQFPRNSA